MLSQMLSQMLLQKLTRDDPLSLRQRWKIVLRSSGREVGGEIIAADCATGNYTVKEGGEEKTISTYPHGIALVSRLAALLLVGSFAVGLSACAGLTPPVQPTPASINNTVQQLSAITASPTVAWQAVDYAVRASCHAYLNGAATRNSDLALASGGLGLGGIGAMGFLSNGGNVPGALAAGAVTTLGQNFLNLFQQSGPTPSVGDSILVGDALDKYEANVELNPPASVAMAASFGDDEWFLCSWGGIQELRQKAEMTAQVSTGSVQASASTVPFTAVMTPTWPGRPHIYVNGR